MKRIILPLFSILAIGSIALPVYASGEASTGASSMQSSLPILLGISAVMILLCLIVTLFQPFSRRRKGPFGPAVALLTYGATIIQVLIVACSLSIYLNTVNRPDDSIEAFSPSTDPTQESTQPSSEATVPSDPEPTETDPPVTEPIKPPFTPTFAESSDPAIWEITWDINNDGENVESYTRPEPISFGAPEEYFSLPGIATFRGNNYRNAAYYGTAEVTKKTLTKVWRKQVGYLESPEWIGCGWTGQPLIVQWDEETKANMNIYEKKKAKEDLVEVIYAKMDGYIHFYDLEDGSATRDPIFMGMVFKGSGALDPRGYPVLYVGGGLELYTKSPYMYIVSLIDGSVLYSYGNNDAFAQRNWNAFDSSPLVDAETDTLIWPGENGILYTMKLNSQYDKEAGTFSVDPEQIVKSRYTSTYSEDKKRYLGYESSACIVENYLFVSENGGMFHCIDLNTMELMWAQDTKDDSNSSPLFDWGEDGNGYIYTAPSLHWTQNNHHGEIPIYKLNAQTGEVMWTHVMDCVTYDGCSGGVQSSPLIGKEGTSIEGLIVYSVGRCPGAWESQLVALDKETGELVWQTSSGNYTWSSPIPIYTEDGTAYIFLANASGVCRLFDGKTGEVLHYIDLDETVEASPVIFNNMIVLGTREGVYGIKVS